MSPSTRRDTISPSAWCLAAKSISPEISSGCSCIKPNINELLRRPSRHAAASIAVPAPRLHGVNPPCSPGHWLQRRQSRHERAARQPDRVGAPLARAGLHAQPRRGVLDRAAGAAAARGALGRTQRRAGRRPRCLRMAAQRAGASGARRQHAGTAAAAAGHGVQRPSVRRVGRPIGRRPGAAARRDRFAARPAGNPAQGQRAHAVFAHGRRARGAALVDPRVPGLRGDAPLGHPDHARAGSDRLAAAGDSRDRRDRGRRDACGAELPALRPLRTLRAHRGRCRGSAPTGRRSDRSLLPRKPRHAATAVRLARRGRAPHRPPDGAVAGRGVLPWRDEHRQPVDPRAHDRLRTVRLPRWLRPRAHLQPQ